MGGLRENPEETKCIIPSSQEYDHSKTEWRDMNSMLRQNQLGRVQWLDCTHRIGVPPWTHALTPLFLVPLLWVCESVISEGNAHTLDVELFCELGHDLSLTNEVF